MTSNTLEFNPYKFGSEIYPLLRLMAGGVKNEVALLIPDYQRNYTWQEKDVEQLLDDLKHK